MRESSIYWQELSKDGLWAKGCEPDVRFALIHRDGFTVLYRLEGFGKELQTFTMSEDEEPYLSRRVTLDAETLIHAFYRRRAC